MPVLASNGYKMRMRLQCGTWADMGMPACPDLRRCGMLRLRPSSCGAPHLPLLAQPTTLLERTPDTLYTPNPPSSRLGPFQVSSVKVYLASKRAEACASHHLLYASISSKQKPCSRSCLGFDSPLCQLGFVARPLGLGVQKHTTKSQGSSYARQFRKHALRMPF